MYRFSAYGVIFALGSLEEGYCSLEAARFRTAFLAAVFAKTGLRRKNVSEC